MIGDDARSQLEKLGKVAPIERDLIYLLGGDHRAQIRTAQIELLCTGFHCYHLGFRAYPESEIHRRGLAHREDELRESAAS